MANSPELDAEGVVRVTLFSDGTALSESVRFMSLTVTREVNRVPTARLVISDGDMAGQEFPVSDTGDFKPGAAIKINAGYGDDEETLFEGVVIKHAIQITGDNDARLVVECRDQVVRMTVGRKNANYIDKTDSDVIGALVAAHALGADVDATPIQNKELVQFYCSDWDFMLSRAEANGLLVIATDGSVSVKAPATDTDAVLKVTYGKDLMEFHAELDARTQFATAQAVSWDMKTQAAILGAEAAPPTLNAHGDLDSATLAKVAGLASYRLQTAAPTTKEVLTQWARSQQLKSGLARVRGHMRFQGSAKAVPGGVIELEGVGKRFSGKVFASGVIHRIADGDWVTEVQFGLAPQWFTEQPDVTAPRAAGLVPAVEGLQVGVVMKLDGDPDSENRVQVSLPVMQAATEGVWARLLQFHGSSGFGSFFVPEVGDEVVLGYFNNDPSHPVILGSLYSSKRAPPYALEAKNNTKAIVTRCQSKIEFNEEDKVITVLTPGNNKIVISDKEKSILLQDQNDNRIELNPGGITLSSPKDIKLSAKGGITLDAINAIGVTSKADVKSTGLNIACEAQVGFIGKGNATAELSAAGQTVVKGAMVMIN
ncbi:type VI secretion system tip protein VgrG [Rhizobacter sp. Root1221]|uniref:type VI secretion system tip protein VgrG n=1 Tax=Rhizobacter sp. Root1221 TaxID=1736433 RepID=UPI0006F98EF0|nr:type VI secretion system tip protein VgrG [Rhizobacter sp. Root1221]KQV85603.1 type VI secretion protein VgrG [Rhizobacter sp. Root1221]